MSPVSRSVSAVVLLFLMALPAGAAQSGRTTVVPPACPSLESDPGDCYVDDSVMHRGGVPWFRLLGNRCMMGNRLLYDAPLQGYYYFHPYHHSHIRTHQMFGELWGEPPENPYANQVFQRIYQQYREEAGMD